MEHKMTDGEIANNFGQAMHSVTVGYICTALGWTQQRAEDALNSYPPHTPLRHASDPYQEGAATWEFVEELFDSALPLRLLAKRTAVWAVMGSTSYAFEITGLRGGKWTVDLMHEIPVVTRGFAKDAQAQVTITIGSSDFVAMWKNPNLGMQLFMQGKLRVAGDSMLAMKLQRLFSVGN